MLTVLTRVMLLIWLGLAGAALTIYAARAEAHPMRDLLEPDVCAMPCFLGIRPGITRASEALILLQHHPWIVPDSLYISEDTTRQYMWVSWRWQPERAGSFKGSAIVTFSIRSSTITLIQAHTRLSLGAVQLEMGNPDYARYNALQYAAYYTDSGLMISVTPNCRQRWQQDVSLYFVPVEDSEPHGFQPFSTVSGQRPMQCRWLS